MSTDPNVFARVASAVGMQQAQQEQERRGMFARAAVGMRVQRTQREIKKLTKEREHWQAESEANERKKTTCMMLMILALGDDVCDVLGALVSVGLLSSITFPIPGIIRAMVATQERTPKPDRLLRAIAAMAIEAIPLVNLLPTTTINLVIDFVEAYWDAEHAKNNIEEREKKIKMLQQSIRQQITTARRAA